MDNSRIMQSQIFTNEALRAAFRSYCRDYNTAALAAEVPRMRVSTEEDVYLKLLLTQLLSDTEPDFLARLGDIYEFGEGVRTDKRYAAELYEEARQRGSKRVDFDLGWMHFTNGEYMKCIESFSAYVSGANGQPESYLGQAYYCLGVSYTRIAEKNYPQAIGNLATAIEKYHDAKAYGALADIYADEQLRQYFSPEKAIAVLRKGVAEKSVQAAARLGGYYVTGKQSLGIGKDYEKALSVMLPFEEADNALLMFNLGLIYYFGSAEKGIPEDDQKAIRYFSRALAIAPNYTVNSMIGVCYYKEGDYAAAYENLSKAVENGVMNDVVVLAHLLSLGFGTAQDKNRALAYYKAAYDRQDLRTLIFYVDYVDLLREYNASVLAFDVAKQGFDKYNDVYFLTTMCELVMTGRCANISVQEAVNMLEGAVASGADLTDQYPLLGNYYYSVGQFSRALKYYTKAFEAGNADAGVFIGRIYERGGGTVSADTEKAFAYYQQAANAGSRLGAMEVGCFRPTMFGGHKRVQTLNT